MKKFGILIFVLGVALTVFSTISFFTKENVVNLGEVEITRKKEHHLNISPLIGIAVIGIGGIIFWQSDKTK
jgi:hypothetical protein